MGFPITLNPGAPTGLDSPRLGDDELRNLKQLLADLFTLPVSPSTISATIGSVSTGGKLTITNGAWHGDLVGLAYGGTNAALTAAANSLVYSTASALALLSTGNNGVLVTSGAGVPSIGTDIPTAVTIGGAYAYRAGGTDVALADGGTNASLTAAAGGLLYSTASAVAVQAAGTSGYFARSGGTGAPTWFDLFGTANTFTATQTISNTAPSLVFTDTTASAKSLTMLIDANIAELRESAGASGSLLSLDLANNRVGIGTAGPQSKLHIQGATAAISGTAKATGIIDDTTAYAAGVGGAITFRGKYNAAGDYASGGYIQIHKLNATDGNDSFDLALGTRSNGNSAAEVMRLTSNGNVGIGTTSPAISALLELSSTTGAFLPPRMTTTQRDALTAVDGMIIYNSTTGAMNYRKAGSWTAI